MEFKEIFVSHVIVVSKKRQLKLALQIIVSIARWRGGKVHGKGSSPDVHKSSGAVHMHRWWYVIPHLCSGASWVLQVHIASHSIGKVKWRGGVKQAVVGRVELLLTSTAFVPNMPGVHDCGSGLAGC